MLNKTQSINSVNWDSLVSRVGLERFIELARQSTLIGMVNWTMLNFMSSIWRNMIEHVLPRLDRKGKMLFVDLADPQRRAVVDLCDALNLLARMQEHVDVTLAMNFTESAQVAQALDLPALPDEPQAIIAQAQAIRHKLNLACVAIHPRHGAAAASAHEQAWFDGPFVHQPRISTGAGDHFNAGFCLGFLAGLNLEERLCAGVSTSGYYVRMAQSPSAAELAAFAAELPAAQA
jgi:sugar/nucleoside kinase (ribokinase family)